MSLQLLSFNTPEPPHPKNIEDQFTGFHRICLEPPYRLDYVSQNFCELMGDSAEALRLRFESDPSLMASQPDQERFRQFLAALAEEEKPLSIQFHLEKSDGTTFFACETATPCRQDDGKLYALCVVSDVSYWPEAVPMGDRVSSLMPYGYLQCTCEKYPRIVYINQALGDYLAINKQPNRWEQNARDNVYFLLPFEEREQFRLYLAEAQRSDHPIRIDHHLFRSDGTRAHLTGWLSMMPGASGKDEYALIYREVMDEQAQPEPVQEASYFPVLKRSYHAIFALDLERSMIECIHGLDNSPIGALAGIEMTLESAKHICMNNYVLQEDRAMMDAYLDQISTLGDDWNGRTVLQTEFRMKSANNQYRFLAVAVHLDATQVLLCCRDITHLTYTGSLAQESKTLHTLYDWLDFLSTNPEGTIGMLMLDEDASGCSLLYGSSSVLHYLGLDTEDSPHRSTPPSLGECLAAADLTKAEFDDMVAGKSLYLWSRSAPDAFQFQLTCKTYSSGNRTLYIIWCNNTSIQPEPAAANKRVFARTFGHFDLFVDNTPITFSSAKEKELMALLIDRNGGTLTPSEAITYLWEDEPANERTSARYRKLAMGLKHTLEKYNISEILVNHNGVRSIDTAAIRCDYYELLAGNERYRQAFHNAYMSDYSWGEETLATLWRYSGDA